jgi:hypothetical protein
MFTYASTVVFLYDTVSNGIIVADVYRKIQNNLEVLIRERKICGQE